MRLQCKARSTPRVRRGAPPRRPDAAGAGPPSGPPRRGRTGGFALLLALLIPPAAAAQEGCIEVPPTDSPAPPRLEGFELLFRQAGVAFLARVDDEPPPSRATVALANENPFPVVADFGVHLAVGAPEAASREVPVGRRCVRLAAGQTVELPALTPPGPGEPIRGVRILNLSISGLVAAAPSPPRDAPDRPDARPAPGPAPSAREPREPSGGAFRCSAAPAGNARAACTAAYLAASARAATLTGAFAGTTRACLAEYAALQERAAEMLRRGDPAGEALAREVPPCFSPESARWDFSMLERLCPGSLWTPGNQGAVECQTPGVVVRPELSRAAPTPDPPPPAEPDEEAVDAAPEPEPAEPAADPPAAEGSRPAPRAEIDLQRVLRLLFGTVLSMAGLGLVVPLLQALALLLLVAPATLLRRAWVALVPK